MQVLRWISSTMIYYVRSYYSVYLLFAVRYVLRPVNWVSTLLTRDRMHNLTIIIVELEAIKAINNCIFI